MPYVLSFEVQKRYGIRHATVSEAIACYEETYRLIGAWLKKHNASADLRCVDTGRVVQLYQGITVLEVAAEFGEAVQWRVGDVAVIRSWIESRHGN